MIPNAESYLNRSCKVFWEGEGAYFEGVVDNYHPDRGLHIQYYDGDDEWVTTVEGIIFEDTDEAAAGPDTDKVALDRTQRTLSTDANELDVMSEGAGAAAEEKKLMDDLDAEMAAMDDVASTYMTGATADTRHTELEFEVLPSSAGEVPNRREVDAGVTFGAPPPHTTHETQFTSHTIDVDIVNGTGSGFDAAAIDFGPASSPSRASQSPPSRRGASSNSSSRSRPGTGQGAVGMTHNTTGSSGLYSDSLDYDVSNLRPDVVLLTGEVSSASQLPSPDGPGSGGGRQGQLFFRILYVEGGSDSSMFRCKTTIFKSEAVADSPNPEWAHNAFNFEMVLPSAAAASGKKSRKAPTAADLSGEILVAVYRTRGVGGNDFVGQTSFDLATMIRQGMPLSTADGELQARTTRGSFDLTDRTGLGVENGALGAIVADMTVRWRGPAIGKSGKVLTPGDDTLQGIMGRKTSADTKKQVPFGGRNATEHKKHLEHAKKIRVAKNSSGYGARARTMADVNRGSNRMVSRKFEQGLLDKQNELYMKRIAKARGNPKASAQLNKAYEAERPKLVEKEKRDKAIAAGRIKAASSKVVNTWDHMYTEPEEEQERRRRADMARPKATTPRLTPREVERRDNTRALLTQRDALKAEVAVLAGRNKDLRAKETRLQSTLKRYQQTVRRVKEGMAQGSLKQPSATTVPDPASVASPRVTPGQAWLDPARIEDAELRDMLVEHDGMHAVRRALVRRVTAARREIDSMSNGLKMAEERQLRAWERLGHYTARDKTRGTAAEDEKWLAGKAMSALEKEQQNLSRMEEERREGLHVLEVDSELTELAAIKTALLKEISAAEKSITSLQYERDMWHERHDTNTQDNFTALMRRGIRLMRRATARQNRTSKIGELEKKADKVELELLRFKLQQAQQKTE